MTRNASILKSVFTCGCEPYDDIRTLRRWNAEGFKVRKGEHGVRIRVLIKDSNATKDVTNDDVIEIDKTGDSLNDTLDARDAGRWTRTVVFCRHQVEPLPPGKTFPRRRGRRAATQNDFPTLPKQQETQATATTNEHEPEDDDLEKALRALGLA